MAPEATVIFILHYASQSICVDNDKEDNDDEAAPNYWCDVCLAGERRRQQETLFEKKVNISKCLSNQVLISLGDEHLWEPDIHLHSLVISSQAL